MDYYDEVREAAEALRSLVGEIPKVAVVLGSGLGSFVESLDDAVSIDYGRLPHWPVSRVPGHDGRVVAGKVRGRTVIVLAGRCHAYEGHSLQTVTFATRVLGLLGIRILILTNAAGAVHTGFNPGALMVIDDHVNLMGGNPLIGPNDDRFGPRFPDMSQVYSARLRRITDLAGQASQVRLVHGVYAALAGPSYETPAEIRYLRTVGVDAVGMSTVPEAIVARHMGLEVLGLSCITNMAAGVLPEPLDHSDVVAAAHRASGAFSLLLEKILGQL